MQRYDLRHLKDSFYDRMGELIESGLKDGEVGIFLFEVGDFSSIQKSSDFIKELGHDLMNSLKFNEVDWTVVVKKVDAKTISKRQEEAKKAVEAAELKRVEDEKIAVEKAELKAKADAKKAEEEAKAKEEEQKATTEVEAKEEVAKSTVKKPVAKKTVAKKPATKKKVK